MLTATIASIVLYVMTWFIHAIVRERGSLRYRLERHSVSKGVLHTWCPRRTTLSSRTLTSSLLACVLLSRGRFDLLEALKLLCRASMYCPERMRLINCDGRLPCVATQAYRHPIKSMHSRDFIQRKFVKCFAGPVSRTFDGRLGKLSGTCHPRYDLSKTCCNHIESPQNRALLVQQSAHAIFFCPNSFWSRNNNRKSLSDGRWFCLRRGQKV